MFVSCMLYYIYLQEASVSLKAEPVGQVGPKGLLYVNQREFAAVVPDTSNYVCSLIAIYMCAN